MIECKICQRKVPDHRRVYCSAYCAHEQHKADMRANCHKYRGGPVRRPRRRCTECNKWVPAARSVTTPATRNAFCHDYCREKHHDKLQGARALAAGVCWTCSATLDTKSKIKCRRCLDANRESQNKSRGGGGKVRCSVCHERGHDRRVCPWRTR